MQNLLVGVKTIGPATATATAMMGPLKTTVRRRMFKLSVRSDNALQRPRKSSPSRMGNNLGVGTPMCS